LQFYIDGAVLITCVKAVDQVKDGSGMIGLNSGGVGHNWVFLEVAGKYGRGFHWYITIYGFDRKNIFSKHRLL
jgi:Transcription activator MBF2